MRTIWPVRVIESMDAADSRDRGYRIAIHKTTSAERYRGAYLATCSVWGGNYWTFRLRYGTTPEDAERRLRDWIEASG